MCVCFYRILHAHDPGDKYSFKVNDPTHILQCTCCITFYTSQTTPFKLLKLFDVNNMNEVSKFHKYLK